MSSCSYSSKAFSYDRRSNCFVAEASDLKPVRGGSLFGQLYPDACDIGIYVVSHVTGRAVSFYVASHVINKDLEVESWRLLPTIETERKFPAMRGSTMIILND